MKVFWTNRTVQAGKASAIHGPLQHSYRTDSVINPMAKSNYHIRFVSALVTLVVLLAVAGVWLAVGRPGADEMSFNGGQLPSGTQIVGRSGVTHSNYDGLAISPDGELLVAATPFVAINRLDLIRWRTEEGTAFEHPDASMALVEPTFSPDGRLIAFVVARPSRAGGITEVSEIWISDTLGNVSKKLRTSNRLYSAPAFSPDGRKLAYFRDIEDEEAGPSPEAAERRASRGEVALALFEYDLALQTEVQLTTQPFTSPFRLHYAKDGSGALIFNAGHPLGVVTVDGHQRWMITPEILAHQYEQINSRVYDPGVYRWNRGEKLSMFPEPLYRIDDDLMYPTFVATGDGADLILANMRSVNGEDHIVVLVYSQDRRLQLFDMGDRQLTQIVISLDRSVAAAFNNHRGHEGEEALQTLVVAELNVVKSIRYHSIRFSPPIILN